MIERVDRNSELTLEPGLIDLAESFLDETPTFTGQAFNEHYSTSSAFIKVTRPWVQPERFKTELHMASAMYEAGLPVAKPLHRDPYSYEDQEGNTRYVTFWRRLDLVEPLSSTDATRIGGEWILRLWAMAPPPGANLFQLEDFLHAVHVRLDRLEPNALVKNIVAAVEDLSTHPAYYAPKRAGLIHGDLHNDNIVQTLDGVKLIDWESSCVGPIEWDAAQNLRYCDPSVLQEQERWWQEQDLDYEVVQFYRRVRSLSSLSHMVAAGVKPPLYHAALSYLDWTHLA